MLDWQVVVLRMLRPISTGALLAVLVNTPVQGQPSGTTNDAHHLVGAVSPSAAPEAGPAPNSSASAPPMSPMCRHMMGDMGMAMGGAGSPDSKDPAAMLEMRGEMLKVMGDIMMKHARRMRGMSSK